MASVKWLTSIEIIEGKLLSYDIELYAGIFV